MENRYKLVDFEAYCKTCKHEKLPESESPCDECLAISARMNSQKPEFWCEKG